MPAGGAARGRADRAEGSAAPDGWRLAAGGCTEVRRYGRKAIRTYWARQFTAGCPLARPEPARALEQGQLARYDGDRVPVQRRLRRPEFRLSAGPRTRDEPASLARARRVVPGEAAGDDGDLATALGAEPATTGHAVSVPRTVGVCASGVSGWADGAERDRCGDLGRGCASPQSGDGVPRTTGETHHPAPTARPGTGAPEHEETPSVPRFRSSEGVSFSAWRRQDSNLGRLSRQIYSLLPLAARAHRRGCCPSNRLSAVLRGNDVNNTRCGGVLRHPIDLRPEGMG